MKTKSLTIPVLAISFIAMLSNLWAGGACSRFSGHADNILKQHPNLYEMVTNCFTIEDSGFLGPLEQREVNGVLGRYYIYHEFNAIDKKSKKSYVLRIHFKKELADPKGERTFDNRVFDRFEIASEKKTLSTESKIEP